MNGNLKVIGGILFIIFLSSSAQGQDPDIERMFKEFEDYKSGIEQKFSSFKDSIDQVFADHVRESWEKFERIELEPPPLSPFKPPVQPKIPDFPERNKGGGTDFTPDQSDPPLVIPDHGGANAEPPIRQPRPIPPSRKKTKVTQVDLYGSKIEISYHADLAFDLQQPYQQSIPKAWEQLSKTDYELLLQEISANAHEHMLNDWGAFRLVQMAAENLFPNDLNRQVLFSCFALNKNGYRAKIGFSNEHLYLLMPCKQQLYYQDGFKINGMIYYVYTYGNPLNPKEEVVSYTADYKSSLRIPDYTFRRPMKLTEKLRVKTVSFEHQQKTYSFPVTYDETYAAFFEDAPLSFELTYSAPLSDAALRSIEQGLKPLLAGKTQKEQVDIILHFVQYGFQYATDDEQFQAEKYFYPEELFYFPSSDCEDRSALFSCLVRNLLQLRVIGVLFPKHAATAVRFTEEVAGDFVMVKDQKYLICDPTYIGADSGMCAPDYRDAKAEIVYLSFLHNF